MNKPTVHEFKAWADANARLGQAVILAQAFAKCERERVDSYIKPLFEKFEFYVCDEFAERIGKKRITQEKDLYMTDLKSPQYLEFQEQCDAENRKHGFDGPKGHCPALIADGLRRDAEYALLKSGGEFLGVDLTMVFGEKRDKALDLLLGATVKAYSERRAA